jgi:Dolichol kinase
MALRKEEVYRKVLHVFTGLIVPGLILYIPRYAPSFPWAPGWLSPRLYPPVLAVAVAVVFTVVELLRFRVGPVQAMFYRISGPALRPEEARKLTGATYIVYSALLCSIVFVNQPFISFMVLCAFIWGDAAAALVGQALGRIKIGKKSLEGSLACFVLCMALFTGGYRLVPHLLDAWQGRVPFFLAIAGSLCITIMELFPVRITKKISINDNLTVPVLTGIVLQLLYPVLS